MSVSIRTAHPEDADAMNQIITAILEKWNSPRPRGADHVLAHYIAHPDSVKCSIAYDDHDKVLGFQSLLCASEGNVYHVPVGWGVIGTYVDLHAGRQGIGKALFASTMAAAKEANLPAIDATIAKNNPEGLRYYDAMGFQTYGETETAIRKRISP